jgi:hypothetical protein
MQVNVFHFEHADEKQSHPEDGSSPQEWGRYRYNMMGGAGFSDASECLSL